MKIFFDTEFIEDGKTIDLLSIGMVREDGATLYMVCNECNVLRASQWVVEHVVNKIDLTTEGHSRSEIAEAVKIFVGQKPEFWAYYADYDWVSLCQLYGTMMELPESWPMWCRDLKQLLWMKNIHDVYQPEHSMKHHALHDAQWVKETYESVTQ